jgi:hypothetical protein
MTRSDIKNALLIDEVTAHHRCSCGGVFSRSAVETSRKNDSPTGIREGSKRNGNRSSALVRGRYDGLVAVRACYEGRHAALASLGWSCRRSHRGRNGEFRPTEAIASAEQLTMAAALAALGPPLPLALPAAACTALGALERSSAWNEP